MTASTLVPFALSGSGQGVKQTIAVDGGSLHFAAEGHHVFGGTDSAPSPLDFALGALTSCTQVTAQIVASQRPTVTLGRWEIAVMANLDGGVLLNGGGGVLLNGGDGVSNFRDVDLTIAVETNLGTADFTAFTKEIEHRCPVTQLFRRSGVTVTTHWKAEPLGGVQEVETRLAS